MFHVKHLFVRLRKRREQVAARAWRAVRAWEGYAAPGGLRQRDAWRAAGVAWRAACARGIAVRASLRRARKRRAKARVACAWGLRRARTERQRAVGESGGIELLRTGVHIAPTCCAKVSHSGPQQPTESEFHMLCSVFSLIQDVGFHLFSPGNGFSNSPFHHGKKRANSHLCVEKWGKVG